MGETVIDERTHIVVQRVAGLIANAEALLIMESERVGVFDLGIRTYMGRLRRSEVSMVMVKLPQRLHTARSCQ